MTETILKNSTILNNAMLLADKEIQKVVDYLTMYDDAWNEFMDLKMYDANYMQIDEFTFEYNNATITFKEDYIRDLFIRWCEDEYDYFKEWCRGNCIDLKSIQNYIGRTSSFYLGNLHGENLENILAICNDDFADSYIELTNGKVDFIESMKNYDGDNYDDFLADLLVITNNLYDDTINYLNDIIKVYEYIKSVKDNQCETFKIYVHEDWLSSVGLY